MMGMVTVGMTDKTEILGISNAFQSLLLPFKCTRWTFYTLWGCVPPYTQRFQNLNTPLLCGGDSLFFKIRKLKKQIEIINFFNICYRFLVFINVFKYRICSL